MKIPASINNFRRSVMQSLTRNVGNTDDAVRKIPAGHRVKRVLICRPNHRLGNLLLVTPLLQEISDTYPEAKIDLFIKGGLGNIVFANYKNVDRIIALPKKPFSHLFAYAGGWARLKAKRYDVAINIDAQSSSGRLSVKLATAAYKFYGNDDPVLDSGFEGSRHIAKRPVYNWRLAIEGNSMEQIMAPVPELDLKLTAAELAEGARLLDGIADNSKKTIAVFTYATGRKCYCTDWWGKFYEELKSRYADYNIVEILPVENVSQLDFKAPVFYSKDVREIASVIANTEIFIGADSGIMHLASASGTDTLGLFSITDRTKYEPYNQNSIAINTNNSGPLDWFAAVNRMLAV